MSRSVETLAVVVVVAAVLFVGCSGGFGPTLPSPDGSPVNDTPVNDTPVNDTPVNDTPVNDTPINDTPIDEACPLNGDLSGTVTAFQLLAGVGTMLQTPGSPVEGALVAATDGVKVEQTVTDANGFYCLDGFDPGEVWLSFSLQGYETEYMAVQFDGNPRGDLDRNLTNAYPLPGDQSQCPTLATYFYDPSFTDDAELRGNIINSGANAVVLFFNGEGSLLEWDVQFLAPTGLAGQEFVHPIQSDMISGEWALFVANATCALLEPVPSQTETGSIRFLIDESLMAVEDLRAEVVVDGDVRVATPDSDGVVEIGNLPPGVYDVDLTAPGFPEGYGADDVEVRGGVVNFLGRIFGT